MKIKILIDHELMSMHHFQLKNHVKYILFFFADM